MGALDGRVVVVTGAGRGLGREHAKLIAAEGGLVVVNDLGAELDGSGSDASVAAAVADEIRAAGGEAVASAEDVATMEGAKRVLQTALDAFGAVHGLVNNAGILRDRIFVTMSEEEWDTVIRNHLKATFCPTNVIGAHWRARGKEGEEVNAAVVNTPSTSGLIGTPGQSNYGAAKAAIASLTVILAQEFDRIGARVNAVVPVARTRITESVPAIKEMMTPPDGGDFDVYHPGNISPMVAWLLSPTCPFTGKVFYAKGGELREMINWSYGKIVDKGERWTLAELDDAMRDFA